MIKVAIVSLGHIKHRVDFEKLQRWRSCLFAISKADSVGTLPDGDLDWQYYTDEELDFVPPVANADITIAITEYALEGNFYIRRLNSSVIALSLFETAEICEYNDIPLENFILKNIYELCAIFELHKGVPTTSELIPEIIHDETRSCLFDMNGNKRDVVYSATRPSICDQCRAKLAARQLPNDMLSAITRELPRIRKPLYYRMTGFVKQHPIFALAITFFAGLFTELLGSYIYDLLT